MPRVLRFLKKAENDIGDIVSYIQNDNPPVAQRFRNALQETGELLLDMPHIGSMRVSDKLVLKDIRVVPVKNFDKYFIFYRSQDDGVEIVRVVHGARDYPALF